MSSGEGFPNIRPLPSPKQTLIRKFKYFDRYDHILMPRGHVCTMHIVHLVREMEGICCKAKVVNDIKSILLYFGGISGSGRFMKQYLLHRADTAGCWAKLKNQIKQLSFQTYL